MPVRPRKGGRMRAAACRARPRMPSACVRRGASSKLRRPGTLLARKSIVPTRPGSISLPLKFRNRLPPMSTTRPRTLCLRRSCRPVKPPPSPLCWRRTLQIGIIPRASNPPQLLPQRSPLALNVRYLLNRSPALRRRPMSANGTSPLRRILAPIRHPGLSMTPNRAPLGGCLMLPSPPNRSLRFTSPFVLDMLFLQIVPRAPSATALFAAGASEEGTILPLLHINEDARCRAFFAIPQGDAQLLKSFKSDDELQDYWRQHDETPICTLFNLPTMHRKFAQQVESRLSPSPPDSL